MCQKAAETAAAVMAGIEPTFLSILNLEGLTTTTNGAAAIAAYNAALKALQNWQSGTPSQDVVQLLVAFQTIFSTLPLPPEIVTFVNIILGGVVTVIGIVKANSSVPVAIAPDTLKGSSTVAVGEAASPEETKAMYQAQVIHDTTEQVATLVPTFKRSFFHSPAAQYKKAWNDAVMANPTVALPKVY